MTGYREKKRYTHISMFTNATRKIQFPMQLSEAFYNYTGLEVCISFCSLESWEKNHLKKNVKMLFWTQIWKIYIINILRAAISLNYFYVANIQNIPAYPCTKVF